MPKKRNAPSLYGLSYLLADRYFVWKTALLEARKYTGTSRLIRKT